MLSIQQVALRRGTKLVLDRASVVLQLGEKVGLVGRNGAGKSSLFSLLTRRLQSDAGEVAMPPRWRIGEVAQDMPETDEGATDFVLVGDTALAEAEALLVAAEVADDGHAMADAHQAISDAGGFDARPRAQAMLLGLGFKSEELDAPVSSFSGGWRMRLQLARALMCPADLMLLDEPTNHLDLDALVWLEAWLKRFAGTMIVISHDREFLDAITDVTLHLDEAKLTRYTGNYTAFEEMRAERMSQAAAGYAKQQERIAHLQKFIDRFKAKASKAKQAQSRVKALARMERLGPVLTSADFQFEFREPTSLPNPMLAFSQVACGYMEPPVAGYGDAPPEGAGPALGRPGARPAEPPVAGYGNAPPEGAGPALGRPGAAAGAASTKADADDEAPRPGSRPHPSLAGAPAGSSVIVRDINRSVLAGQRIGILGANGQGKSTLVKTIIGELPRLAGEVTEGKGLSIGYFAQQELDVLSLGDGPLLHMIRLARDKGPAGREQELRDFLGSFRFTGEMVSQPVGTLSGGEKARLVLAMLVWQRPNLLLMDEPTNHLDLTTREALSMALNEFEGTVMLVSHDRALLREVCDEFWLVADGAVKPFDGDLDDYQRWLLERSRELAREQTKAGKGRKKAAAAAPPPTAPIARPPAPPPPPRPSAGDLKRLRQELGRVDARLAEASVERGRLEDALARAGKDVAQRADHGRRLKELGEEIDALEARWLDVGARLDSITADTTGR